MPLTLLSSMAVQPLLGALLRTYEAQSGQAVRLHSVGGVEAVRLVRAGEVFDLAVLAHEALAELAGQGCVARPEPVCESRVALAVRQGDALPDIGSEAAVRSCLRAAAQIAYSTGPSGQALLALLRRLGLDSELKARLVQAPPGVPVGALLRSGQAQIGVQQLSELQQPGVTVLGCLPDPIGIVTTFSGAVCRSSSAPLDARELLDFLGSPATAEAKLAHWMAPPSVSTSQKP